MFGGLEERLQGEDAVGAELPPFSFDEVPVDVYGHAVVSGGFDLLEDI